MGLACTKFFDADGDGHVTFREVTKKFGDGILRAVNVANQVLPMVGTFIWALQANGAISEGEARKITDGLDKAKIATKITGKAAEKIGKIGIPKSLQDIGDWDGDGDVDKDDAIKFCDETLELVGDLIKLGVDPDALSKFRTAISAARDVIAAAPNTTVKKSAIVEFRDGITNEDARAADFASASVSTA